MNLINFLVSLATFSNLINISKAQQCKQFYIRKEIRSMSSGERQAFFNALTKLHNTKPYPGVGVNKLDWFAYAHNIVYDNIHNHPVFLPWHRYYMQLFQEMIWQVDPSVIVPYWDWTIDSQAPHLSPVFTNEYFGGNGNSNNNFAIQDGFMANWSANYPNKHAIARNFQQSVNGSYVNSNEIAALPSSILMDSIINNNKIFSSFAFNAELYHGYLHYAIGGDSAEMSKHYSPNDLIFFLHHGYVDRFWWIWQKRNPDAANKYDGQYYNPSFNVSASDMINISGAPSIPVSATLNTLAYPFCYAYSDSEGTKIMLDGDSSSLKIVQNTNLTRYNINFNNIDSVMQLAKEVQSNPNSTKYSSQLKDALQFGESNIQPLDPTVPLKMMKLVDPQVVIDNINNANDKVGAISSLKGFNSSTGNHQPQ